MKLVDVIEMGSLKADQLFSLKAYSDKSLAAFNIFIKQELLDLGKYVIFETLCRIYEAGKGA